MPKPTRVSVPGGIAGITDDLRLIRSKGGVAAAQYSDVVGTAAMFSADVSEDDRLVDAQEIIRSAASRVCGRIHETSAGHSLDIGATSLERILLAQVPVTNGVTTIRRIVAGEASVGPDVVLKYEDQVIQLIAREIFSALRPSAVTHRTSEAVAAHLPRQIQNRTGTQRDPVVIREAIPEDHDFVVDLIYNALSPYYGGDHKAHAERIFSTHIAGGIDHIGHFSTEQRMFVALLGDHPAGIVHLVGKRQRNYKISPLIVVPNLRGAAGIGQILIEYAELYAREHSARQIYCTVAENNESALKFFVSHGYIVVGQSASHYKPGMTEKMMFKPLDDAVGEGPDRPNISVVPCEAIHEPQVRALLLEALCQDFLGIDDSWVDSLFDGYRRRDTGDINLKYKLLFVAVDRDERVLGVAGATPKKGQPIKIMPFCATTEPAFLAFLTDLPFQLKPYGRKIYAHLAPTPTMVQALQQHGWSIDAAMPRAYHEERITYQWSLDLGSENIRTVRVKDQLLDYIREGRKTLEVRVGYDGIKKIKAGDLLNLTSHAHEQAVKVVDVRNYVTFQDMLKNEDADRIVPGFTAAQTLELLKNIYPPKRERLGVVVLEIEKVDTSALALL